MKDADKMIIPFGKYEGEYLGDVIMEDRQYVEWLADNSAGRCAEADRQLLKEVKR